MSARTCPYCEKSMAHKSVLADHCGRLECSRAHRRGYYKANAVRLRTYYRRYRRKPKKTKTCEGCNIRFETAYPQKRFCTPACRKESA